MDAEMKWKMIFIGRFHDVFYSLLLVPHVCVVICFEDNFWQKQNNTLKHSSCCFFVSHTFHNHVRLGSWSVVATLRLLLAVVQTSCCIIWCKIRSQPRARRLRRYMISSCGIATKQTPYGRCHWKCREQDSADRSKWQHALGEKEATLAKVSGDLKTNIAACAKAIPAIEEGVGSGLL